MTNYGELSYLIDTIIANDLEFPQYKQSQQINLPETTQMTNDLEYSQRKQPQQTNLPETKQISNKKKFIDKYFPFLNRRLRSANLQ